MKIKIEVCDAKWCLRTPTNHAVLNTDEDKTLTLGFCKVHNSKAASIMKTMQGFEYKAKNA